MKHLLLLITSLISVSASATEGEWYAFTYGYYKQQGQWDIDHSFGSPKLEFKEGEVKRGIAQYSSGGDLETIHSAVCALYSWVSATDMLRVQILSYSGKELEHVGNCKFQGREVVVHEGIEKELARGESLSLDWGPVPQEEQNRYTVYIPTFEEANDPNKSFIDFVERFFPKD